MKGSKRLILLSILIGIATVFAVYSFIQREVSRMDPATYSEIVVANSDIQARTKITADMLKRERIQDDYILPGAIRDEAQVIGKYAAVKIVASEQIINDRLVDLDRTFFSYKVPLGYVAITIPVDSVSGVADQIRPGDFVDVFVYLGEKEVSSETTYIFNLESSTDMLQNVLVLSVDKTSEITEEQIQQASQGSDSRKITLSLEPKDAEKLVLAHQTGYIHLGLRNPEDESTIQTGGTVRQDIINR